MNQKKKVSIEFLRQHQASIYNVVNVQLKHIKQEFLLSDFFKFLELSFSGKLVKGNKNKIT